MTRGGGPDLVAAWTPADARSSDACRSRWPLDDTSDDEGAIRDGTTTDVHTNTRHHRR
jgi:hypothetical protein